MTSNDTVSSQDINLIINMENDIHTMFKNIDYENLTRIESSKLKMELRKLDRLLYDIKTGYYK